MHDVVIRGGRIVDGTGRPAVPGDVAVDGGVIAAVGRVDAPGREEIDAAGQVVTPGFVDVHDFPGGAPRLVQRSTGYRATLVNGQVSVRDGEHTGACAGAVLRHR